jgi:hypothetical protein
VGSSNITFSKSKFGKARIIPINPIKSLNSLKPIKGLNSLHKSNLAVHYEQSIAPAPGN